MSLPAAAAHPLHSPAAADGATSSRSLAMLAAVPIALHAVLAWLLRAPTLATGNDDAVYLLLARALRDGHYRELFYAGTPMHSQYPPAYPALLALLGAPADGAIGLLVAVNIALSCVALALLFDVMRRWSLPLALAGVAVLAVNPSLIWAASRVQSEPMFMAATVLALWALRPGADSRHRWIAIAATVVAALTRSAGIAVIAGVLVHFMLLREWRWAAILALVSAVAVGPWLAWTIAAPQKIVGRSYIADALMTRAPSAPASGQLDRSADQPVERPSPSAQQPVERPSPAVVLGYTLMQRVQKNIPRYLTRSLPTELSIPTVQGTIVDNAAWLLLMLSALAVGVVSAWSRWRAAVLVLLTYGALLAFWPYVINRFLTPLLPVFVSMLLLGGWRAGIRLLPRAPLAPALLLAAIPLGGGAQGVGELIGARHDCPPVEREEDGTCAAEAPQYRRVATWLAAQLPENAYVFTSKEGTFYYRTGRQVISLYPAVGLPAPELAAYLREHEVAAVFLPHAKYEEKLVGAPLEELCTTMTNAGSPADHLLILWTRPPAAGESDACEAVTRWRATW